MNDNIIPLPQQQVEPRPFDFQGRDVRVIDLDDEPWFVASDVSKILGYESSYYLTRGLDEDEKGAHIVGTPGGGQEMTIISESGLYSAILRSRVEGAKAFKKWVTSTVLPAIRKTGSYGTPVAELSGPELMAKALIEAQATLTAKDEQIKQLEPPAKAWRELSSATGDFCVSDVAKIAARAGSDTGPRKLHKQIEEEWKWIFRRGEKNKRVVSQDAVNKGWMVERITSGYFDQATGERKHGHPEPRVTLEGVAEIVRRLGGDVDSALSAANEAAA